MQNIRNFSIIAHVNHGKTTLTNTLIKLCYKNVSEINFDNKKLLQLENEKGITIKSKCITLYYENKNNVYTFNIIDTPGHSDFMHEVIKTLKVCEGVILIIDVNKGIEAQTKILYDEVKKYNLKNIIVLNKIDITKKNINDVKNILTNFFKIKKNDIIEISAKNNIGIKNLLDNIITKLPAPSGNKNKFFEAIIIDYKLEKYKGLYCTIKILNGRLEQNDTIYFLYNKKKYIVLETGIIEINKIKKIYLSAGEIGYILIKENEVKNIKLWDIITKNKQTSQKVSILKNKYKIFVNIYPINLKFNLLEIALNKLQINDYKINRSHIFGVGIKCGFLGMLHLEMVRERIKREFNLNTIITPPNIKYKIVYKNNNIKYIIDPNDILKEKQQNFLHIEEPIIQIILISPNKYLGKIKKFFDKNLIYENFQIFFINNGTESKLLYNIPLSLLNFYLLENLQIITNGFIKIDYIDLQYKKNNLSTLEVFINNTQINEFTSIIHVINRYKIAKKNTE